MIQALFSIISIVLAITILIGFHEFGHFIVARFFGIKVLRFSIGFGHPIWRWHDKTGTEYVLALIPLGGYVRMLDEREAEVMPHEAHLAFNRQSLYKRVFVVLAGPVFNMVLAFFAFWWMFVIGVTDVVPIIGEVTPNSIAAKAGLHSKQIITAVDGYQTSDWTKVGMRVITHVGNNDVMIFTLRNGASQEIKLNLANWSLDALRPKPLESLGIQPFNPTYPVMIKAVLPKQPAADSGMKSNDVIVAIDKQKVLNIPSLVSYIAKHPQQAILFQVERQKQLYNISVTPMRRWSLWGQGSGYIGVEFAQPQIPANLKFLRQYSLPHAFVAAWNETRDITYFNLIVLKKLISGKLSIKSLGGPISLFQGAAVSADYGFNYYLGFLGLISIGLAVINLLPIPGLDGGHLFYFMIEVIIRRPLSVATQVLIFRLGIILLLYLMTQAVLNDLMRL